MKNNKPNKANKIQSSQEFENPQRTKKKLSPNTGKVNVKSNKFWNDIYDEEGEEVQKYIR
ncbi:MAG: hypothetical protein LC107_03635 [Chitinophagales bacterium]|nr:hypothetical protein [Chitinophagales bacterium]